MMKTILTTTTIRNNLFFFRSFLFLFTSTAISIPAEFLALENHRMRGEIHAYQTALEKNLSLCHLTETKDASNAGYCALIRNERLQWVSPPYQKRELEAIYSNLHLVTESNLPLEEKLFIEMRLYAYLPKAYGQNFPKSLVALESLKRLKKDIPHLEMYEKEIRFLQGKSNEENSLSREEKQNLLNHHSFGWILSLRYFPHLGLGGRVGYQDSKIQDGPWGAFGYVEATTKPVFGGNGGVQYTASDYKLSTELSYRNGKENFYGIGPGTLPSDLQLWEFERIELVAVLEYYLAEDLTLSAGLKLKDVKIRFPLEERYSLLGPLIKLTNSTLDQEFNPRSGYRVSTYGYFQKFQQLGIEIRGAIPLGANTHLNLAALLEEQFGRVPSLAHLRLGETFYIPGVSQNRFQDRTFLSGWGELRQNLWGGMGGGMFGSIHRIGDTLDAALKTNSIFGGGAFIDWRWTRFLKTDSRIEVSQFGGETLFQIGVASSF